MQLSTDEPNSDKIIYPWLLKLSKSQNVMDPGSATDGHIRKEGQPVQKSNTSMPISCEVIIDQEKKNT